MINKILLKIIEDKYSELQSLKTTGIFEKINNFEGNAIGQIGEKFIKEICEEFEIDFDNTKSETIHDEYDILINNKKSKLKPLGKVLKITHFNSMG